MRTINNDLITNLVNDMIRDTDLFITEIKIKKDNVIYVFLDGDKGVTIDQCIQVSRFVEKNLDRDKIDFELNVSSFGIGRPLILFRQFKNAIGKSLCVKFKDESKCSGKLIEAFEDKLMLEIKGIKKNPSSIREIPMQDIKEAKIEVVFNKN